MRSLALLMSILCCSALLQSSSQTPMSPDQLALWSQAVQTATQAAEQQLLAELYGDRANSVLEELDDCEATESQAMDELTSLQEYANLCAAYDPSALVARLIQDVLTVLGATSDCGMSVDLLGDMEAYVSSDGNLPAPDLDYDDFVPSSSVLPSISSDDQDRLSDAADSAYDDLDSDDMLETNIEQTFLRAAGDSAVAASAEFQSIQNQFVQAFVPLAQAMCNVLTG